MFSIRLENGNFANFQPTQNDRSGNREVKFS